MDSIFGNGGKVFSVGDSVWVLIHVGNKTSKRYHGTIISVVKDDRMTTGSVEIETAKGKVVRAPSNKVYDHMPKPFVVEDELGKFTAWE